MKINTMAKKYAIGLAFTVGVLLSTPASALTFTSCTGSGYDISTKVDGAINCTIANVNQDNTTAPLVVNGTVGGPNDGFFGIESWLFAGKLDETTGLTTDATLPASSGSFSISATLASSWDEIMLVFKDGAGTTLVGYLLDSGVLSGNWLTPFLDPPFGLPGNSTSHTVSHISVYYTECPPGRSCSIPVGEIPLPAGILLLISALGGLGFLARFRKAGATA